MITQDIEKQFQALLEAVGKKKDHIMNQVSEARAKASK
jgi:hypothetical protein